MIPETQTTRRLLTGRRGVRVPRPLIEGTPRIDARELRRAGVFHFASRDRQWRATWAAALGGSAAQHLAYRPCWSGEALQGVAIAVLGLSSAITSSADWRFVELMRTGHGLVGYQWWFLCPACSRRARIIYSPLSTELGALGCRVCLGLTYRSRREHRQWTYERLTAPAERLGRRLRYAKPYERQRLRELTAMIDLLPGSQ